MALLSFPHEIQSRIISEISSIRDLATLSQTCRSLHHLCDLNTRRQFYRIRIYPNNQSINQTFDTIMKILKRPILGNYVQKIEQYWRPMLEAPYVETEEGRELSTGDMNILRDAVKKAGFVDHQERMVLNMLMQNETKDLQQYIRAYGQGYSIDRVHGIFIAQALTAIIISISPNLESLAMTQPVVSYSQPYWDADKSQWSRKSHTDFPLDQFLRQANTNSEEINYLRNLRHVYIIVDEAVGFDNSRFYIPIDFMDCTTLFNRLPSIESISTDALCEDEDHSWCLVPRPSDISRIHLNHCALGTTYLAYIIQCCKILREFQYTIGGRGALDWQDTSFNVKTFIKSILPHKDTLEVLDIDAEANMYYFNYHDEEGRVEEEINGRASDIHYGNKREEVFFFDEETDEIGSYFLEESDEEKQKQNFLLSFWGNNGSLREFRTLKRLSIGIWFLIYFVTGVEETGKPKSPAKLSEGLPESLEYLCIWGYQRGEVEMLDKQVDSLVELFKSGLSSIKEIVGIDKEVPSSRNLRLPDDMDLLWKLEDAGYGPQVRRRFK